MRSIFFPLARVMLGALVGLTLHWPHNDAREFMCWDILITGRFVWSRKVVPYELTGGPTLLHPCSDELCALSPLEVTQEVCDVRFFDVKFVVVVDDVVFGLWLHGTPTPYGGSPILRWYAHSIWGISHVAF